MVLLTWFWGCWLGWAEVTLVLPFLVMVRTTALGDAFKVFAIFRTGWPSVLIVMMFLSLPFTCMIGSGHDIASTSYQIELSSVHQPAFCTAQLMVPAPLRKKKNLQISLHKVARWSANHFRWLPHWEKVKGWQSCNYSKALLLWGI